VKLRDYDHEKDRTAVHRIWREIGWIGREKREEEALDTFTGCGRALVAEVHGEAECLVLTAPSRMRYLNEDLLFSAVTSVSTSRVARKRGLAARLTAQAVAADAADGALVAGLGMFEQGFYDQLGFGTGGYEHWIAFDPARLRVDVQPRLPKRITCEDWALVHASRLARQRGHGACNLLPPEVTRAEMIWSKNGFGLGYCDGPGEELTHHIWCVAEEVEFGPYTVLWTSYEKPEQFLELMAMIRDLGDQVRLLHMCEPHGIQLQDLIKQPFRQLQVSERSRFESRMRASAYWQMRICDLEGCLERTHLHGEEARFNLTLTDPIARFLAEDTPWRGIAGEYVVSLGPTSGTEAGRDPTLPSLSASVGAFTRMWLGVRPATGLAVTDDLTGPRDLLEKLDWVLRLPEPKPDWEF
jgi:hypothetical protein